MPLSTTNNHKTENCYIYICYFLNHYLYLAQKVQNWCCIGCKFIQKKKKQRTSLKLVLLGQVPITCIFGRRMVILQDFSRFWKEILQDDFLSCNILPDYCKIVQDSQSKPTEDIKKFPTFLNGNYPHSLGHFPGIVEFHVCKKMQEVSERTYPVRCHPLRTSWSVYNNFGSESGTLDCICHPTCTLALSHPPSNHTDNCTS